MMQRKADEHEKQVVKPGRKCKEQYTLGEIVWVQDMKNKKWDKKATVQSIRTSNDGTIVSYGLLLNGADTIRHRRYMRKVHVPDIAEEEVSIEIESAGEDRQAEPVRLRKSSRRRNQS